MEQIYNTEELYEKIKEHPRNCVRFILDQNQINEWKESGKFAFIKKELAALPMKFACTQLEYSDDCAYYFICNTEQMAERLITMLRELYIKNTRIRLVKCGPTRELERFGDGVLGNAKACLLF